MGSADYASQRPETSAVGLIRHYHVGENEKMVLIGPEGRPVALGPSVTYVNNKDKFVCSPLIVITSV